MVYNSTPKQKKSKIQKKKIQKKKLKLILFV